MTIFQSNQLLAANALGGPVITGSASRLGVGHGLGGSLKCLEFQVDAAAAILTTDSIEFGMAPKGFRHIFSWLKAGDIGAATTVLNVGDAALATRIFAAATIGQAGGAVQSSQAAAVGYQYTADTLITGSVTVASGDAAGSINLFMFGLLEGLPS